MPVFYARAWHQLRPSAASRWAVRNRRYLGLAFATAHLVHLVRAHALQRGDGPGAGPRDAGRRRRRLRVIAAMAATSNDWSVRTLGARNWKRLHTVGIFWIWGVFTFSYFGRVAEGQLFFVPFLAVALAGLALRLYVRFRRRAF